MNLKNVSYVPLMSKRSDGNYLSLMSVRLAANVGYILIFSNNSDLMLDHNEDTKIDLIRSGGLTWVSSHFLPTSAV